MSALLRFLPEKIYALVSNLQMDKLSEIRLRVNKPIFIHYNGVYQFLAKNSYLVSACDIEEVILRLTKHSVYAYEDNIRQGFLTGDAGERVGLCGTCVFERGNILTIKDITSLCIRVPRQVFGIADFLFKSIFANGIVNLLVVSPPGMGKTTLLREIARQISTKSTKNILVLDEKNELFSLNSFDLGITTDVLSNVDKAYGFTKGVANLRPDVIVCDELSSKTDVEGANFASLSGVKVIASAHASTIEDLRRKPTFNMLFDNKIFDYAVILSDRLGLGTVEKVINL